MKVIADIFKVPVELLLIDFETVVNILSTFFIRLKTSPGIMTDKESFLAEITIQDGFLELKRMYNNAMIQPN